MACAWALEMPLPLESLMRPAMVNAGSSRTLALVAPSSRSSAAARLRAQVTGHHNWLGPPHSAKPRWGRMSV